MIVRRILLWTMLLLGCGDDASDPTTPRVSACDTPLRAIEVTGYHGGPDKLGHVMRETRLTPDAVAADGLQVVWSSEPFHRETIDGVTYEPHVYASPLYVDRIEVTAGPYVGSRLSLAFAGTSNGWMYAVNASEAEGDCGIEPGETVWARRIAIPGIVDKLDGGMPMGILGTPVIDLQADPPRLYVTAMDRRVGWQLHALDAGSGHALPGWPLTLDPSTIEAVDTNGPSRMWPATTMSQRGGLTLSPQGHRVYVPFGSYWGESVGWLVAVDVPRREIGASFSAAPWSEPVSNGGMWGSAGPTVAEDGAVWITTGNGPAASAEAPDSWSSSLLQLSADLDLERVYTPANYCRLDAADMDLGASQPLLLPAQSGPTPNLVAFGGKQGVVYLVDRDTMEEAGPGRGPCATDMAGDRSLHPPGDQPQWGRPGPLSVFGPYSDTYGQIDHAKMRTKLAYYADLSGHPWLFAAGSSKAAEDSTRSVPPGLAKLDVVASDDAPANLAIAATEDTVTFANPGPPVVSSHAGYQAVVWVLDANAPRTASLVDPDTPGPVLYAFAADDLRLLWRSPEGALARAGKYATPVVAHGRVLVGTDRIVAFGP